MREEDHERMDNALYGNSLSNNEIKEVTEKQLIRPLFFIQSIFTLFNQEIGVAEAVIDIKFKTKYISTIVTKELLKNAVQTGFPKNIQGKIFLNKINETFESLNTEIHKFSVQFWREKSKILTF